MYAVVAATLTIVRPAARKHYEIGESALLLQVLRAKLTVIKPGIYSGESCDRNTVPPIIPPTPEVISTVTHAT